MQAELYTAPYLKRAPLTRVDDFDTFWAKIYFCLAGFIFLVGILKKWDVESYSSVEAILLVPVDT